MGALERVFSILAPPRCAACDAHLRSEAAFCAACVATLEPPPVLPRGVTAAFAYGGALSDAIRSCKYTPRADRLRVLARLVVHRLPDRHEVDLVAPVPLHRARLVERGFDQAAILARAVARALERPCAIELLERVIDTPHLAALEAADRGVAVREAFRARPCDARVLLVDDVYTTGATTGAARDAIARAGGAATCHVLAATPRA